MSRSTCPAVFPAFLLLLVGALSGCSTDPSARGFVTLQDSTFMVRGKPFFPIAINYIASVRSIGDSLWISPSTNYASFDPAQVPTRATCLDALRADMELIHEVGFNTVRIVGFAEQAFERDTLLYVVRNGADRDTLIELRKGKAYERYLSALKDMLDAVRSAGLRAILLTQVRPLRPEHDAHFANIADRFANDTVILAYDLFNEPLYFDRPERPKAEAQAILEHWRDLFDAHAPNQLYTLGLTGIRETFEFDPNMLGVDFISYHPYEYEPEQVRNELRWYHNNVAVPWIIGETAIPADNDSVPYQEQRAFAEKTLMQSRACGALGYSWWQFQDVKWGRFHADFMGVLNRDGITRTKTGAVVNGTLKPVAEAFRKFDPWADAGACICLPNYLNYSDGRKCKITGRLVDEDGQPINEGTILAWNEHWNASHHTTSGPDGRFELRSPFWLYHWMVSATRYSMDRGDSDPNGFLRGTDGIPTFEVGDITLERLPFVD
ncbi:MAG: cellulase family glycosylhydrolase [Flavobacteriales bacterium]